VEAIFSSETLVTFQRTALRYAGELLFRTTAVRISNPTICWEVADVSEESPAFIFWLFHISTLGFIDDPISLCETGCSQNRMSKKLSYFVRKEFFRHMCNWRWDGVMLTGLVWLMIGTGGELL
jgi:hypothetical protein